MKNITLPIGIIIASIVLGSFIFATQLQKQDSIEKQQVTELQAKKFSEDQALQSLKDATNQKNNLLNECIKKITDEYENNLNINRIYKTDYCDIHPTSSPDYKGCIMAVTSSVSEDKEKFSSEEQKCYDRFSP